jgi:hypothetical protein
VSLAFRFYPPCNVKYECVNNKNWIEKKIVCILEYEHGTQNLEGKKNSLLRIRTQFASVESLVLAAFLVK